MADLPIVCTLTLDALRARREGLLAALLCQSTGHEALAGGAPASICPVHRDAGEYRASRRRRAALLSVSPLHNHG